MTMTSKSLTSICMMADTRTGPHIVHGPDYGFVEGNQFLQIVQREESLVDPVKMNDIGCLDQWMLGEIRACVGNGDLEKRRAGKTVTKENNEPLPKETQQVHFLLEPRAIDGMDVRILTGFVAYQHGGLNPLFA